MEARPLGSRCASTTSLPGRSDRTRIDALDSYPGGNTNTRCRQLRWSSLKLVEGLSTLVPLGLEGRACSLVVQGRN